MAAQDPLDLLRAAISSSLPITLLTAASEPAETLGTATYISILTTTSSDAGAEPSSGVVQFEKDAPTRYTSKSDTRTDFFTIGQLWLAWVERDSEVRQYLIKGQEAGGVYVGIADRKAVVDYLSGAGDGMGRVLSKDDATAGAADGLAGAAAAEMQSAEAGPSRVAPAKRKYEVNVADREFCRKVRAQEVELRDRNSILRSCNGGKINNFTPFLQTVMAEKIRTLRASVSTASSSKTPQPAAQPAYDPNRAKKAKSSNPIIIVSSSPTALITMWNVKKFLEQGIFEPSETARQNEAAQGNRRAEDMIPIMRKRTSPTGEITQKYYIVDGVEALSKFGQDAWDRVICVLTTGQAWQFKAYKWQDPKTLFRHVKGVYFQWNNEQTNPAVKDWNITEMRIDRTKRHTDRQAVAEFWRVLDSAKKR